MTTDTKAQPQTELHMALQKAFDIRRDARHELDAAAADEAEARYALRTSGLFKALKTAKANRKIIELRYRAACIRSEDIEEEALTGKTGLPILDGVAPR